MIPSEPDITRTPPATGAPPSLDSVGLIGPWRPVRRVARTATSDAYLADRTLDDGVVQGIVHLLHGETPSEDRLARFWHACGRVNALDTDGRTRLLGAGVTTEGQLGTGEDTRYLTPFLLTNGVRGVSGLGSHSLRVGADGVAWATGYHIGPTSFSLSWRQVPGITGVAAVAAGGDHSLFLRRDGTLFGSGSDEGGALGLESSIVHSNPVEVRSSVRAIAASRSAPLRIAPCVWFGRPEPMKCAASAISAGWLCPSSSVP